MRIDVNLKVPDDFSKTEITRGWVEIENMIKFPVRVLKYIDDKDNKEKMFVSFPQKKNGDNYDEIVHPINKDVRKKVTDAVLDELKKGITKGQDVEVTDVRVSLLKEETPKGDITLKAMASVTMYGFVINGIQVKEGRHGLFVQMPQHRSDGQFKDTVYGTSASSQAEINRKVLEQYETELEKKKRLDISVQQKPPINKSVPPKL